MSLSVVLVSSVVDVGCSFEPHLATDLHSPAPDRIPSNECPNVVPSWIVVASVPSTRSRDCLGLGLLRSLWDPSVASTSSARQLYLVVYRPDPFPPVLRAHLSGLAQLAPRHDAASWVVDPAVLPC